MNTRSEKRAAFTLIELLVVIGIIGVLSAMIMGIAGLASRKSMRSKCISTMGHIQNCLEEYRVKKNEYPTTLKSMYGVVPAEIYVPVGNFYGPLDGTTNEQTGAIQEWKDPWGSDFVYQRTSGNRFSYKLWSKGPNSESKATSDDIVAQGSAQ